MERINTFEKKDTTNKKQKLTRTKNVFGKKLGRTNLVLLIVIVSLAVFAARFYVTKLVQDQIDEIKTEASKYKKNTTAYVNQITNQTVAKYTIDEIIGELPREYSINRAKEDVINALWAANVEDLVDARYSLSTTEVEKMPFDGATYSKALRLQLSVQMPDVDSIDDFIQALSVKSRIYYIAESSRIKNPTSASNEFTFNMVFYTFYEDVPPVEA